MPVPANAIRFLGIAYLLVQAAALVAYWVLLAISPAAREPFLAAGAPHSTLMAFMLGDLTIYAGASIAAAIGLLRRARWTFPILCMHAGAAAYAASYALALAAIEPARWLGAAMMLPAIIVPPFLAWHFRPGRP